MLILLSLGLCGDGVSSAALMLLAIALCAVMYVVINMHYMSFFFPLDSAWHSGVAE